MAEDWRVHVDLGEGGLTSEIRERMEAHELDHAVRAALGDRIVVSDDGRQLFLYADSRRAAEAGAQVVRTLSQQHGWRTDVSLMHWHENAEDWEPADAVTP